MTSTARRARELRRLFAIWKRACDARDIRGMNIAMRAIDAAVAGETPRTAHMTAIEKYFR